MTTLLTIAEVLAGEALVSPGGPVDRVTAVGDDEVLWALSVPMERGPVFAETGISVHA